jgi:hypothetical protein
LTSTDEIFALAGVDHITIAPGLLKQLEQPSSAFQTESLFDSDVESAISIAEQSFVSNESAYRIAFTRDLHGASEEKLTQASWDEVRNNVGKIG